MVDGQRFSLISLAILVNVVALSFHESHQGKSWQTECKCTPRHRQHTSLKMHLKKRTKFFLTEEVVKTVNPSSHFCPYPLQMTVQMVLQMTVQMVSTGWAYFPDCVIYVLAGKIYELAGKIQEPNLKMPMSDCKL